MDPIVEYIKHPRKLVRPLGDRGFFRWMPDEPYLKLLFKSETSKDLNIEQPLTYNEKIQWLKLYNKKKEYSCYADKYAVRKYIAEKIGERYLIPLIGVYDKVDEIPWEELPNQFVVKCTHGSNCNIICKCKSELDIDKAKKQLIKWMGHSWYTFGREWVYKNIKPRIIIEKYMVDESNIELKDYKMFCFDGKVKLVQVDFGRHKEHKRNIYDEGWNFVDLSIKYPNDRSVKIKRPKKLEEMLEFGSVLSKGIPHVRVDFYSIGENLYFGELTFYHGSGFEKFFPDEYDAIFGGWIELPIKKE